MPIEIREIVIRATVNQGDASAAPANVGTPSSANTSSQDVLQECIEQIAKMLEDIKER